MIVIRDSFALRLAEAALKDAGIPYVVESDDPQYLPGLAGASSIGATPLWQCEVGLRVPEDLEEEARELLEPLLEGEGLE